MANTSRNYRNVRSVGKREVVLSAQVMIGAAGAITFQTPAGESGFVVSKNAQAGLYDILFFKTFTALKGRHASMELAGGGALPTTTGVNPYFRPGATTSDLKSAQVQFYRTDTNANADTASGNILFLTFHLAEVLK